MAALSLLKAGMNGPEVLKQQPEDAAVAERAQEAAAKSKAAAGLFGESLSAAVAGDYQGAVKLLKQTDRTDRGGLADELDRASRVRVQELLAAGSDGGREEAIRHLAGMQDVLSAADPAGVDLKVRRVRCESLQLMADLMSQTGNYSGAFDVLTTAALLTPDLPGQDKLASAIADRMVSQLEAGGGGLKAEIVIPELDGGAGFGLPAEMQASLKGRA
ncbi:MAG: hypothetical protein ACKPJJ_26845, partial [Planctomycetaceae bacterium]